jgi:copper chaperone CopZ
MYDKCLSQPRLTIGILALADSMEEKPCPPDEESCPVGKEGASTMPKGKRTASFGLTGMTCATCAQTIQRSLEDLQGVESANVNLATEKATVVYDLRRLTWTR